MSNHYHVVLETPNANLAAGMAWLQSTYTIRANCAAKRPNPKGSELSRKSCSGWAGAKEIWSSGERMTRAKWRLRCGSVGRSSSGEPARNPQLSTFSFQPGLLALCRAHGIRVVEDAAHAFPARLDGRMIGEFGDATCFSFYANKTITTGEGGMLTTDDEQIFRRVKIMRLHGIDRDIWNRFTSDKPSWEYDVVAPGYKYNMPDVNAAIGLAQLPRADEFRRERQRCAEFYFRELKDIECIDLPEVRVPFEDHAWHLFPIVLKEDAPVQRDHLIELLANRGIGTSVHYKPLHRMTYYRERYGLRPEDFPNAERIWRGCLSLPIYPSLRDEELHYITDTIQELLRNTG
jgi:dTDP-4-amino-4,6-dideoxygalactose transaminase